MDVREVRKLVVDAEVAGPGPGLDLGLFSHVGLSLVSQLLFSVLAQLILRRVCVRVAGQVHPAEEASFY